MPAPRQPYRKLKLPTLLEILGGVSFAVPVWLPHPKLVCSRCFQPLNRVKFSKKQRENRVEPVCLECEALEKATAQND